MRITERERDLLAGLLDLVTDAVDLELLGVARGDAVYHVVDERSRQTVKRLDFLFLRGAGNENFVALNLDAEAMCEAVLQLALGALNRNRVALADCNGNTGGNYNGHSTNS